MNSEMLKIVLGLVAVFVILTVANVVVQGNRTKYETEVALISKGNDSELVRGVFIRDETLLQYQGSGVVCYEVSDGGKVSIGSVVANVYSSDEQVAVKRQIEECQRELTLLGQITNPGTAQSAQPSNISALFSEAYKSYLYQREKGDMSELNTQKENMLIWLSTYQLVTGTPTDYAGKIESLTSQLESLRLTQEAPIDTVASDKPAYFVSYADGYEETLTIAGAENLLPEDILSVEDHVVEDSSVIGKLISDYRWELAAVVDNSSMRYKIGDALTLKFASTSTLVSGEVVSLNESQGAEQTVILISCDEMTYDLVQHRVETVEIIQGTYDGILVPRSALHFQTFTEEVTQAEETGQGTTDVVEEDVNYRGVYVLDGEQPAFRKVDVCYEGTDFVISEIRTDSDYLQLYDSIITKGIDANGE